MATPGFWDDNESAQVVIDKVNQLKSQYDTFKNTEEAYEELELLLEMVEDENDSEMTKRIRRKINSNDSNC